MPEEENVPKKTLEEIKEEARAYALSGSTKSKKKNHVAVIHHRHQYSATQNQKVHSSSSRPYVAQAIAARPCHRGSAPASWAALRNPVPTTTHPSTAPNTPPPEDEPTSQAPPPTATESSKSETGDDGDDNNNKEVEDLDDYSKFVKFLGLDIDSGADETIQGLLLDDDDDEEEFQLDPLDDNEDDDEEDEDEEDRGIMKSNIQLDDTSFLSPLKHLSSPNELASPEANQESTLHDFESESNFYKELEEELGWLEEEDLEAAVATLLDEKLPAPSSTLATLNESEAMDADFEDDDNASFEEGNARSFQSPDAKTTRRSFSATPGSMGSIPMVTAPTPLRDVARVNRHTVTPKQHEQLRKLMEKHYQLLMQQAVLAVRTANIQRLRRTPHANLEVMENQFVIGGETLDDLVEILDGAVGMLQDLDQNRKDAIRQHIQFEAWPNGTTVPSPRRSLLAELAYNEHACSSFPNAGDRRLTRAQFTKALLEQNEGQAKTVFDIKGLSKLKDTFNMIDKSVEGVQKGDDNILEVEKNAKACEQVFSQCGAAIDRDLIPGSRDVSTNFVDTKEYFGSEFKAPCTTQEEMLLRRNRNLFTAGEDNLVLRGVNLYGEKQWMLIADRYLPDRSINIISQRYGKLCYLLYKSHGVKIDKDGHLERPPKLESVDDLDEEKLGKIKKVPPPAILNVHRWSLEEDLTLLNAVPLMGSMWAELRARFIPHRDRGHLRKRYQVLERRVKATAARIAKHERTIKQQKWNMTTLPPFDAQKQQKISSTAPASVTAPVPSRAGPQSGKKVSVEFHVLKTSKVLDPHTRNPPSQQQQPANLQQKVTSQHHSVAPVPKSSIKNRKLAASSSGPLFPGTSENETASVNSKLQPTAHPVPYYHPHPYPPPSHPYQHPPIYYPHMYYPVYHYPYPYPYPPPPLPDYADESSRAAFEQLVHDPNKEWSQMSNVKRIIDSDESLVASTIVTQLAKSPAKIIENTGKVTEDRRSGDVNATSKSERSVSLLQGVLDRTRNSNDNQNVNPPMKIGEQSSTKAVSYATAFHHNPYSPPGSPLGSPGFTAGFSPLSASLGLHHNGSPPASMTMFPGSNMDYKAVFSSATSSTSVGASSSPESSRKTHCFGDGSVLMDTDLEAISALNSLSHSPAKFVRNETINKKRSTSCPAEEGGSAEPQSLFSKIVGAGGQERKGKRYKTDISFLG